MEDLDACQSALSNEDGSMDTETGYLTFCSPPCSDFYIKFAEKCENVFQYGDRTILRAYCNTDFLPGSPPAPSDVLPISSNAAIAQHISISNIIVGVVMTMIAMAAF